MKKFTTDQLNKMSLEEKVSISCKLYDVLLYKFNYDITKDEYFKYLTNDISKAINKKDESRYYNILILNMEQKAIDLLNEKSVLELFK